MMTGPSGIGNSTTVTAAPAVADGRIAQRMKTARLPIGCAIKPRRKTGSNSTFDSPTTCEDALINVDFGADFQDGGYSCAIATYFEDLNRTADAADDSGKCEADQSRGARLRDAGFRNEATGQKSL